MLHQGRTTRGGEKMPKKLDLGDSKFTLGEANCESMIPAGTKDLSEVEDMGGELLAEDEDIIHVDKTEG